MIDAKTLLSRSALVSIGILFLMTSVPASACKVIRYKDGEPLCHTDNGHGSSSKKKGSGVPAGVTAGFVEALDAPPKRRTWRDRFNNPTWRERFGQRQ